MTDEKATRRLPFALDVLLVCTVAISFLGGMLILFAIGHHFEEHAREYETLGDFLGLLVSCFLIGSHLGLIGYLECYIAEEVRLPRRVFVVLQLIAIVPLSFISESLSMAPALYLSACAVPCYVLVRLVVVSHPVQVNVFFACIPVLLVGLGLVGRAVLRERAAQQAEERRQREREFEEKRDALFEEHKKKMMEGTADFEEFFRELDRLLEEVTKGGYKAPHRTPEGGDQ